MSTKEGTIRLVVEQRGKSCAIRARDANAERWMQKNGRSWAAIVRDVAAAVGREPRGDDVRREIKGRLEKQFGWAYDFDVVLRIFHVETKPCPGCVKLAIRHPKAFEGTVAEAHGGFPCSGDLVYERVEER